MKSRRKTLFWLLLFNGISAAGGGIALMVGAIPTQPSWIEHTSFTDMYLPGVILMSVVGGSALVAAAALMKSAAGWELAGLLSGVIMLVWIVGEVASIRGFHFLQVIYFVAGGAVIWATPKGEGAWSLKAARR